MHAHTHTHRDTKHATHTHGEEVWEGKILIWSYAGFLTLHLDHGGADFIVVVTTYPNETT